MEKHSKHNKIIYKGKVIYCPSGAAKEYSYWASNFFIGCSNMCTYCYLKKGITAKVLGGDTPKLKKCFTENKGLFKSPNEDALQVFKEELFKNLPELQKHGLFFSFTTDPFLKETYETTWKAIDICLTNNVPVKTLTKCTAWAMNDTCLYPVISIKEEYKKLLAFGFTLTGHDELEPNAAPNLERIAAIKKLHELGFKTFASIEPIINLMSSYTMIKLARAAGCDLFKIGLESGAKYNRKELFSFIYCTMSELLDRKVYFKDSLLKQAGVKREDLPLQNCVNRDYNIFNS